MTHIERRELRREVRRLVELYTGPIDPETLAAFENELQELFNEIRSSWNCYGVNVAEPSNGRFYKIWNANSLSGK